MAFIWELGAMLCEVIWIWALYDCYESGCDNRWRFLLLLGNFPAAVIYLILRKNGVVHLPLPLVVQRWLRRKDLGEARFSAQHIGNEYHYLQLGKALYELRYDDEALTAYEHVLQKEPANAEALWHVSLLKHKIGQFDEARRALEKLLETQPDWMAGEAALMYIRMLIQADEFDAVEKQLAIYLRQWNEPEANYYQARLDILKGNTSTAEAKLQMIMDDVSNAPPYYMERHMKWYKAAKKLLTKIPRARELELRAPNPQ